MPRVNTPLFAFNRGVVSPLALARIDVERLRLAASEQTNWLSRTLGPMMLRPGMQYLCPTYGNQPCRVIPFIYSSNDTAAIELTHFTMRVLVNDQPITRPAVQTVMGQATVPGAWSMTFGGAGTGVINNGGLWLNAVSIGGVAKATQYVGLGANSINIEHAIRIVVARGPIQFRVGSYLGGDNYVKETLLETGEHSLAFTPWSAFYVEFQAVSDLWKGVNSVYIEPAGQMVLTSPWAEYDLSNVRYDQSADVIFVACKSVPQQRIERRAPRSWSVVDFKSNDGPFTTNIDENITIRPSGYTGNIALTSSAPIFTPENAGSLYRLWHSGQTVAENISASNAWTNPIKVTGVGATRGFSYGVSGNATGTWILQRSFDGPDSGYQNYTSGSGTNGGVAVNDGLDNSIVWYRLGFADTYGGSGYAGFWMVYASGGGAGIARAIDYVSAYQMNAEVLVPFFGVGAVSAWKESSWSERRGWPTSVALYEGRLWWAGNDRFWGSASDNYASYGVEAEGDSTAIDRTIGQGPIATINWLVSTQRLMAGADASIIQCKSNSFDEPLTPTNFNLKRFSTQGSYPVSAQVIDNRVVFVQQSNRKVYQIRFDVAISDYQVSDLTRLNDEIGLAGFVDMAVQRQPDTYIHFAMGDGKIALLVYDIDDQVEGWFNFETDGFIEAVYCLPGDIEDRVYYVVRRTVNGQTVRYHERLAMQTECQGGLWNKQMDSFGYGTQVANTVVSGLGHLEGRRVAVWADGKDLSPGYGANQTLYTVTGGSITLPVAVSKVVVGLPYTATFVSAKLAYAAQGGTALNQNKRLNQLGLILNRTHARGLRFGDSKTKLDALPQVEDAQITDPDTIWQAYDNGQFTLLGEWSTDSRLVLEAQSPRPCCVMAAVIDITTNG